jgi:hypothetical protein
VAEDITVICDNSVTTQKMCDFSGEAFKSFGAILFNECNYDTTALQQRVLQTAL